MNCSCMHDKQVLRVTASHFSTALYSLVIKIMHQWPTAKTWPVSNRFNQSVTVSQEGKHFPASVFQKSVLFVQISSFNQHKAAWSSLDKLVPCLNNRGCMRSRKKARSRHPLLLCVQTERQTSFSGGAVAYKVYGKTQFDTKPYPYRLKMFQLPKFFFETYRDLRDIPDRSFSVSIAS